MDKEILTNQFNDTQNRIKILDKQHKLNQHTILYKQDDLKTRITNNGSYVKQIVNPENVIDAIINAPSKFKIGVLNFASATHVGGGVSYSGTTTQEEALCRVTSLYSSIKKHFKDFYQYNRDNINNGIYPNQLLYTENCQLIKDADFNPLANYVKFDMVTMAAPNKGYMPRQYFKQADKELVHKMIMTLSAFKKHHVDYLILGAFGCGAFHNDPKLVAEYWNKLLNSDYFNSSFKKVIHPIYTKKGDWNKPESTYNIFKDIINPKPYEMGSFMPKEHIVYHNN